MNLPILIQLGCGPFVEKTDWIDCDGSWNAWINRLPLGLPKFFRVVYGFTGRGAKVFPAHVKYVNLHKRMPFADLSADAVYASHVWEHLYVKDGEFALLECYRVCKPGGVVRIVVPPLHDYCADYIANPSAESALALHEKLLYRHNERENNLLLRVYTAMTDFHTHKFMYDVKALSALFVKTGFIEVREMSFGESRIPKINQVENPGRVGRGIGFVIEGVKPLF